METTPQDATDALRHVESAEDAAWRPRPVPKWYWWSVGLLMAGTWAAFDIDNKALQIAVMLLYPVCLGAVIGLSVRKQGMQVRLGRAPRPVRRAIIGSVLVMIAAIGVVALALFGIDAPHPWLILGAWGLVVMVIGGPLSERHYKKAWETWKAAA